MTIERYPLTSLQRLVLAANERNPRAGWHAHAFKLSAGLASTALVAKALQETYRAHPILNARFIGGIDGGKIEIGHAPRLAPDERRVLGPLEDPETIEVLRLAASTPPALNDGALFDVGLYECGDQTILIAHAQHIVIDALSRRLLSSTMLNAAVDARLGQANFADGQRTQIVWEQSCIGHERLDEHVSHVRTTLKRNPPLFKASLTTDDRHPGLSMGGVNALTAEATRTLDRIARMGRTTPFTLVCTAFSNALAHLTGRESHLISVQYSTRARVGLPNTVGNFIDYLPLEVAVVDDVALGGTEVGRGLQRAIRSFVPVALASEQLGISTALGNPLLKVTANLQPPDDPSLNVFLGLPDEIVRENVGPISPLPLPLRTVTLEMQDLGLIVGEYAGRLRWRLTARTDHVPLESIDAISTQIGAALLATVSRQEMHS